MSEIYDCIIIGAGWYGLAAAKAYIEDHPQHKVLVVEAENSCGGTWSHDRLYPGLKSNNLWGSYEYPDFPMLQDVYGVGPGQHIPAAVLHRYLTDFAKKFGVFERTRFNTKVTSIESTQSGGWKIGVKPTKAAADAKDPDVLATEKLIVATGLTSEPNLPTYKGQEDFTSPFFHAKDFCSRSETVDTCTTATVVGAGKSAFDVAYAFATAKGNQHVDLIIRPTGDGPVWLCPPYVTPLQKMTEELLSTRAVAMFSPCPWGEEGGYGAWRRFLHSTGLGNWIVGSFFSTLSGDVVTAHGYRKHPELASLEPWQNAMWTGSGVGIHNYPTNFFDLVKEGKIRVHIADIESLKGSSIILDNGETFETDVLICATGWKKESALKFTNYDRGLKAQGTEREAMIKQADEQVLSTFPMLKKQPTLKRPPKTGEPLRNYRFIVPSQSVFTKNIASAGMVSTVTTATFASVQGLWISKYFDGALNRAPETEEEVLAEVMLHTQFEKWRYPCGYGASLPDFAFDSVPYVDMLLNDLGLKVHRKGSWWAELTQPYKPRDYAGLAEEWQGNHSQQ